MATLQPFWCHLTEALAGANDPISTHGPLATPTLNKARINFDAPMLKQLQTGYD